jgi:trimeric autotransporter adhesin
VRPPTKESSCPFCNGPSLLVSFSGPLSIDEIRRFEQDRRAVEEHELRIVAESRKNSNARQLTPADFGLSDENAYQVTPSTSPTRTLALLTGSNTAALATSPLRSGLTMPDDAAADDDDDDDEDDENTDKDEDEDDEDAERDVSNGDAQLVPEDFGLSAVPARFAGMSIAEIDEALLEEAIAMSLKESVSPSAGFMHAPRAAAASLQSSPSSALRAAPAPAAADGEASAESSSVDDGVVATRSQVTPISAPQRIALRKDATPPIVLIEKAIAESAASSKSSAKHSRTTSTSSIDESESTSLDPAMRNSLFAMSVPSTSSADVSDPEDDVSPSKKTGSQRRRRKTVTATSSSSSSSSSSSGSSTAAAAAAPGHRRTSSASKPRDAVET